MLKLFSDSPHIASPDITDASKKKCVPCTVVVGTPGDPQAATVTVWISPLELLKAAGIEIGEGGLTVKTPADATRVIGFQTALP